MTTLGLLSHADPHGLGPPHLLRPAEQLRGVVDRLPTVCSSPLRSRAPDALHGGPRPAAARGLLTKDTAVPQSRVPVTRSPAGAP